MTGKMRRTDTSNLNPENIFYHPITDLPHNHEVYFIWTGHRDKANYSLQIEKLNDINTISKWCSANILPDELKKKTDKDLYSLSIGHINPDELSDGQCCIAISDISKVEFLTKVKGEVGIPTLLTNDGIQGEAELKKCFPSLEIRIRNHTNLYVFDKSDMEKALKTYVGIMSYEILRFIKAKLEYDGPNHGYTVLEQAHLEILGEIAPQYTNEIMKMQEKLEVLEEKEKIRLRSGEY
jgi:hypothetical protein